MGNISPKISTFECDFQIRLSLQIWIQRIEIGKKIELKDYIILPEMAYFLHFRVFLSFSGTIIKPNDYLCN